MSKKEQNEQDSKIEGRVEELELDRIVYILRFKSIDDWIDVMEKRWKGRVTKRDLISLYKWIKDIYATITLLEERIKKLENPDSK